jgi:hypothetical protein
MEAVEDKEFTIVTCVSKNGRYLRKFERALGNWHQEKFISDNPMIIFAHTNAFRAVRRIVNKFKDNYYDIKLIKWSKPECDTVKEEMLSAFVFGVHEHVKTKYSVKIDCDTHLKEYDEFVLPRKYRRNVITAHKWRYTKCKSDPEYEETGYHWFDRLADWAEQLEDFVDTQHQYERNIEDRRYGHKRVASFCCIQKQAFIAHVVDMCNRSGIRKGRMPIPSHDTFLFYVAQRLGRGIGYANFKKYFHTR